MPKTPARKRGTRQKAELAAASDATQNKCSPVLSPKTPKLDRSTTRIKQDVTNNFDLLQETIRGKLCNNQLPENVESFKEQKKHLLEILKRCANLGESNSALLIGPRGAGKSMLMKDVLKELHENNMDITKNLLEVHLNGLLQTDDRIALKEITRQLNLDNVVGDKVFGSFAENLAFLLEALKTGSKESKPVLFILDEFDLFAHHRNQTLLYNLFDICQSAQTPIVVIGLTCRLDVVELLEKRVKSRFSHRQIHVFNTLTFDQFMQVAEKKLQLPKDFKDKSFMKQWHENVKMAFQDKTILDVMKKHYEVHKDIHSLQILFMYPLSKVSALRPHLSAADFVEAARLQSLDAKPAMLHGVSVLQLCLIIAMRHLVDITEGEPFNFEMVYNEYLKFLQKKSHSIQSYDKAIVLKAFEQLVAIELVHPADNSTRTQKEYRPMNILLTKSQLVESLNSYQGCPSEIKHWAVHPVLS
ncbi:origin recognition complex subunit 4-like [Anneissia japonica]|uniref:origin recognition complex subunit 4-like n=1 Tax=Anneissia japonica TaxID=1529436 RepID=UPI0014259855|nr:origin recognition complex subunit 4-like [Anneissia japonica]XP_033096464.1 origin recognition complex subunit 4-like [Anneissia japonica]